MNWQEFTRFCGGRAGYIRDLQEHQIKHIFDCYAEVEKCLLKLNWQEEKFNERQRNCANRPSAQCWSLT